MTSSPPTPGAVSAWRGECRALLALSWPLILTNAIEMVMNMTNVALIARTGPAPLAAATLGLALHHVFLMFGIGLSTAVAPLIARERGRDGGRAPALRRVLLHGLWAVAAVTVPIWAVLWWAEPILLALGQQPALAAGAARYLHVLQWGVLPLLFYFVLRTALAGLERPRAAVVVGLLAVVLNGGLNAWLIEGGGPVPPLGLVGSGLATVGANLFLAGCLLAVVARDPGLRALRLLRQPFRPDWIGFGALWRLGLPVGMALVLEGGMFSVATAVVGVVDAGALPAHAIVLQVATLTFMVPLGIAQAATVRIGRALGAGDGPGLAGAGWTALGGSLLVMMLSGGLMIGMPGPLLDLFLGTDGPGVAEVRRVATALLAIAGLFQVADGAQVTLSGMLRGLQDTRAPMLIAALGYWGVGLPLGAALAWGADLGARGVWLGLTAGLFVVAGLLLARWRHLLRRVRPREPVPVWRAGAAGARP